MSVPADFLRRASRSGPTLLVLVALLATAMRQMPGVASVESDLAVVRDRIRNQTASGRTVLVEIDAKSLAAFDRWPLPRSVYGAAVDVLRRDGARTIAFDVDVSSKSDPVQDAAFADAIRRSDVPVALPTFRQPASNGGAEVLENLPIAALRQTALLASVNIAPDRDGFVRSIPYGVITAGLARPSIAAMLADASGRSDETFPIDGAIDPSTAPRISLIDLVRGHVPAARLRGRNVLIGATAVEMGDRYLTPRWGTLPGALIQLLAAETLIAGSSPVDHGALPALLILLCGVWLAHRLGGRAAKMALAGAGAALLALPLCSEAAHLGSFEVVPALMSLAIIWGVVEIRAAVRKIREARLVDLETGLPNGRALEPELATLEAAALIALRLSNLGDVAGVMGQACAAEVIRRVADRVTMLRGCTVHRVENSALAWIEREGFGEDQERLVDAVAAVLRAPIEVAGRGIELSAAFGLLAIGPGVADPISKAILAADRAAALGLRYQHHTDEISRDIDWRLDLAGELDRAMASGDIWVAYQPKYAIAQGRVTGAEALVRWRHPTRGAIPPDAFIPALEASGRIADLTLHVVRCALSTGRDWREAGVAAGIAVNVSALLPTNREFMTKLEALISDYPDVTPFLTFEVTESAMLKDTDAAVVALERLTAMGVRLSIDDYGTGQSTLSYLKRLPASEIKIDQSFVKALETSRGDQAMVRSSIALAHELGFKVVAEGVETVAILERLADYGCDVAQGWHVGRPMTAEDFLLRLLQPREAAEPPCQMAA